MNFFHQYFFRNLAVAFGKVAACGCCLLLTRVCRFLERRHVLFLVTAFFWAGLTLSALAQDYVDIGSFGYYYSPNNSYKEAESQGDVEEIRLNLLVPKPFKNGDVFIFALNAHRLSLYKRNLPTTEPDDRLEAVLLRIGYTKKLTDNWSITALAVPQLNGEFGEIGSSAIQYGGLLMLNWRNNGLKKYQFGLYVNPHLFGTFVLPLLGFDWRLGDRWQLYGTLPFSGTASYKISERYRGGFNFYGNLASYRYGNGDYLEKSTNEVTLFLDMYATKNFVFRLQGGYSIARHFRRYDDGDKLSLMVSAFKFGDERMETNHNLGDGLILRGTLIFRVPRPE